MEFKAAFQGDSDSQWRGDEEKHEPGRVHQIVEGFWSMFAFRCCSFRAPDGQFTGGGRLVKLASGRLLQSELGRLGRSFRPSKEQIKVKNRVQPPRPSSVHTETLGISLDWTNGQLRIDPTEAAERGDRRARARSVPWFQGLDLILKP
jgi:hypothetical protein